MALILTLGAGTLLLIGLLRVLSVSPFSRRVQPVLALMLTVLATVPLYPGAARLWVLLQHRPAQWVLGSCGVLVLVVLGAVRAHRRRAALRAVLGEVPEGGVVNVGVLERHANGLGERFAACRTLVDTYERHGAPWGTRGSQFRGARRRTMALLHFVRSQTRQLLRTRDDPAVLDASLVSARCLRACQQCTRVNRHAGQGAFRCGAQAIWDGQAAKTTRPLLPEGTLYLEEDGSIVRG